MRKAAIIFASLALVLGLSGCGEEGVESQESADESKTCKVIMDTTKEYFRACLMKTYDGRTLECAIYNGNYLGGSNVGSMSCDWANASDK